MLHGYKTRRAMPHNIDNITTAALPLSFYPHHVHTGAHHAVYASV
jgi:hypothetical protein